MKEIAAILLIKCSNCIDTNDSFYKRVAMNSRIKTVKIRGELNKEIEHVYVAIYPKVYWELEK